MTDRSAIEWTDATWNPIAGCSILSPGDRFALTPTGRNAARPRGTQAGVIVSDRGDCWEVRYDGTTSTRWLFKSYARPEWQAAVDAA